MISQGEGCREDVAGGGGSSTHVKRKKNHQLQNFTPLGHIS